MTAFRLNPGRRFCFTNADALKKSQFALQVRCLTGFYDKLFAGDVSMGTDRNGEKPVGRDAS